MPVSPFFGVFALIAEVRNNVVPVTTGDDQPWPGTLTTHFTCSVFDHVSGSFASSASPLIPGPRKPGHATGGADEINDGVAPKATISRMIRLWTRANMVKSVLQLVETAGRSRDVIIRGRVESNARPTHAGGV